MKLRFPAALLVALTLLLTSATGASAQSATLAWDASADSSVTGYRVSYGTASRAYSQAIDVGNVTQYTVTGLDLSVDYYFAVQAYTAAGMQSGYSNEASLPAPVPPGTTVINGFTANVGFPVLVGSSVTWTANAVSKRGPVEYKFLTYSPAAGWAVAQNYTTNPSFTWTLGWNDIGTNHLVQVWARTVGSPAPYEAWTSSSGFDVLASPVRLTSDTDFPTPPGQPVHWTAIAAGASSTQLEYRFLVLNQGTGTWTVFRDYATTNVATWTPSATGNYVVQVWARRVGTTASYDVWAGTSTLVVSRTTLQVSLSVDKTLPATTGTTLTWTAKPKGGTTGPIQYQFIRYSAVSGWTVVQPYSTSNTFTWTPSWGQEGQYALQVWAKNGGSTATYDAWIDSGIFDIQRAPVLVTVGSAMPVPPGTAVTITGQVGDTSTTFEYAFYLYSGGTGTWSLARAYSTNNAFTWTPASTGSYLMQVWARKVGSTAPYDAYGTTDYMAVAVGPAQVAALNANVALPARAGTAITWTATGVGGTASPLQYRFLMYTEGSGWTVMRDWAAQNTATWTPTTADVGNHLIQVWVRSAGSTATYEGWAQTGYFIIQP